MFIGWFAEENQIVRNETIINNLNNHILHMDWIETPTNHVDIFFRTNDLTHVEIEEFLIIIKLVDT